MVHLDGDDDGVRYGVRGISKRAQGDGVSGYSISLNGVYGESDSWSGVSGYSKSRAGVYGHSDSDIGVYGDSNRWIGLYGSTTSYNGSGVHGFGWIGVRGESSSGVGVLGYVSWGGYGVYGSSYSGSGVYGHSSTGYAAYLDGNVVIKGHLQKGGGRFKIDHPLDPANKYLSHSFVESPDMKNVYDGIVALDDNGEAEIELPNWFGALNKDFRYQLTAIGAPGPNLYIAEEIFSGPTLKHGIGHDYNNGNRFKVAGGTPGMKVSWQVTGIRKDPWANANRIQVEEDKPAKERGYYIYPDLYDQPEKKSISRMLFPEAAHK
jgi:hypothetical protein